jgi:hypothetical protein
VGKGDFMALTPDFFNYALWSVGQIVFLVVTLIDAASFILWKWDTLTEQMETRRKRKRRTGKV